MPVLKRLSLVSLGTRAVLWMLASSLGAVAMGQETEADDIPPERVARLSYAQGGVSLQAVGETEWAAAPVNRPIVPGDYLRTEWDGRAELQVGEAAIRLGSGTGFTFVAFDERALRMRVTSGVVNLRVRELGESDVIEVETPQAVASVLRPGNYRLEVNANGGATVVKVSSGMLEARGSADQSFVVRAQQAATLTGTERLAFSTGTLGAPDSFDEWSLERDQRIERALSTDSAKYVSGDVVGYEDLDSYGTWRSEPDYGYVWSPTRVVAGWSPYSYGRYSYISGWGWTWIDDAPWGFAPFHYGNWVTIGGRWCWVPGPRHVGRPIGRPGDSHRWRIPPTPRGATVRNVPRGGLNPDGGSSSLRERGDRGGQYGGQFGGQFGGQRSDDGRGQFDGERARNPRLRTAPVERLYRNTPAGALPGEDRRMTIPRNELPRNTFPRQETHVPSAGGRAMIARPSQPQPRPQAPASRPEASSPPASSASPPPQQQQSTRPDTPRPTFSRGGGERGRYAPNRPATRER